MNDQITCPHCQKQFPVTEALSHQMEEKFERQSEEKINKVRADAKKWREEQEKSYADKYAQTEKEIEEKLKIKVQKEMELKLQDTKNESEELKKEKEALQSQVLETNKLLRQIKTEKEQMNIEMEKKLVQEEEKIRQDTQKKMGEEYQLKMLEKDKKITDAMKMVEEYKRKLEQGSQQLQGEVLELELENILRSEFPYDEIRPVAKGVRGGDVVQIVKNPQGATCGSILWELKRTKAWSKEWIVKLKDDQRAVKAEIAVLISQSLPDTIKKFGWLDGVCIGDYDCIKGIAHGVRNQLIEVTLVKSSLNGKKDKMEVLYNYLSGTEFRHRVEAIIEAFSTLQDDIEKEKRWFAAKWSKQEKNIRKVMDNTLGMHGDLQSIIGKALPEIEGIDILPSETKKNDTIDTNQIF